MRFMLLTLAAIVPFADAPAFAAGNASHGAVIFQRCVMCHSAEKNGGNGLGPNLFAVAGRKAASLPDFCYSPALKNAKIAWSDDKLKAWVSGPARLVPGNRMAFPGLTNPSDADDVIAYLHTKR